MNWHWRGHGHPGTELHKERPAGRAHASISPLLPPSPGQALQTTADTREKAAGRKRACWLGLVQRQPSGAAGDFKCSSVPKRRLPFQSSFSIFSQAFLNEAKIPATQRDPPAPPHGSAPSLLLATGSSALDQLACRVRSHAGREHGEVPAGVGGGRRLVSCHWPWAQAVPCLCREPASLRSASPPRAACPPGALVSERVLLHFPASTDSPAGQGLAPSIPGAQQGRRTGPLAGCADLPLAGSGARPAGASGGRPRGRRACRGHQRRRRGSDALAALVL